MEKYTKTIPKHKDHVLITLEELLEAFTVATPFSSEFLLATHNKKTRQTKTPLYWSTLDAV
jgi:hypothetical protein